MTKILNAKFTRGRHLGRVTTGAIGGGRDSNNEVDFFVSTYYSTFLQYRVRPQRNSVDAGQVRSNCGRDRRVLQVKPLS